MKNVSSSMDHVVQRYNGMVSTSVKTNSIIGHLSKLQVIPEALFTQIIVLKDKYCCSVFDTSFINSTFGNATY